MAILADLLVRFGADSAELRKALKTVESDVKRFTRDIGGMKKALSGAFAVLGVQQMTAAMARFVQSGVEAADEMGKLAQKSGIAVDDLSRLSYAAELSGSSTEGLATGLKVLARTMSDAAGGSKETAAVFRAIGVEVQNTDGTLRASGDVLRDVADRFAGMEDGAGKAAIAQALFGRSGADLIPMLNEGSSGLARLADEADRLGITIDGRSVPAATELNDNFDRLRLMARAFSVQLAGELTPALRGLTDQIIDTTAQSGGMHSFTTVAAAGFKVLASAAVVAWGAIDAFATHAAQPIAAIGQVLQGEFANAAQVLKNWGARVEESTEATKARLEAIWGSNGGLTGVLTRAGGTKPAPIIDKTREKADEAVKAIKSLQGTLTGLETQVATFGKGEDEVLAFRLDEGDLHDELAKAGPLAAAYREQILAAAGALRTLEANQKAVDLEMQAFNAVVADSQAVIAATRTPAEQYANEVARLDALLQATAIDQETYNRAVKAAAAGLQEADSYAKQFATSAVHGFFAMARSSEDAGARLRQVWESMLSDFIAMVEEMVAKWITAQITMAAVNVATGGATAGLGGVTGGGMGAGVSAPELFGKPSFSVAGVNPSNLAAAGASKSGRTEVNMYVTTLDSASFGDFLSRNEGTLAAQIEALSYKGRI